MKAKMLGIISIPMCITLHQKHFKIFNGYGCGVGNTLWLFANHFWQIAPNLIIFEPLVSALYHFFSKTNTWRIVPIPLSMRSNQNIFFVFLSLGHSASDTMQPFLVDLGQIWSFLVRWFYPNMNFTWKQKLRASSPFRYV